MKIHIVLLSSLVVACHGDATTRQQGRAVNVDSKDPKYLALAWNPVTAAVNKKLKDQDPTATAALVPVQVLSGTLQIVAGLSYELDVEMAESKCKIGENTTYSAKNCPLTGSKGRHYYHVRILRVPWLNKLEVTNLVKLSST